MFNVAVLRLKDIIKYLIGMVLLVVVVFMITSAFPAWKENSQKVKQEMENKVETISKNSGLSCFEQVLPVAASVNKEYSAVAKEDDVKEEKNILQEMLATQIASIKAMDESNQSLGEVAKQEETDLSNTQVQNSEQTAEQTSHQQGILLAEEGLPTQVITQNPITESFNVQYGNVKIKNQTSYTLTEEMMTPDITIENKNIVLFHTHSCESYTSSEAYPYTPTGTFRTTDLNFTVTRVGTELESQLKQYGYSVVHDTSYHDYPAYNGSYTRSLQTVENILKQTPSDIIIDLHRDAIGSRSDYAPIVKIGENDVAAQMMFVIGTNAGGLWHPNWNQNLKFAIKVQQKAEEMYPGLFKPIMLTTSRYNQHTGKYASIIEVGATGNTLEQCLTSMKYLAKVMSAIV